MKNLLRTALLAAALASATIFAREPAPTGVIGVDEAQLTPDYWIARLDAVPFDVAAAIATQNAKLQQLDSSIYDLRALPATLDRARIAGWIGKLADPPSRPLFDVGGKPVAKDTIDAIVANRALEAIPASQPTRYGLVVRRAALRSFPTELRVFSSADDHDIDRFQESALFPGTPLIVAHASRDGRWRFVVSPSYAAWMAADALAEGSADQVFGYVTKTPYRIVTGATVRTVFTPEQPALSQLQLDMGVRAPVLVWSADKPVNGQNAYAAHVIELPLRGANGKLEFAPALLPKTADTARDYLPMTRANLLRQAFKFLGERYGWGNSYDARDCSGFVSDVYQSFGVRMPRNTRDQGVSPAFSKRTFGSADNRAARLAAVRAMDVGDLVYIPGHVMMAIGQVDGEPYVIHDTTGIAWRRPDGTFARTPLNSVSVTPLTPLQFNDTELYVDRITSIVRIRPDKDATRTP